MRSRAALAVGKDQPFEFADVDIREPRDREVLIRVVASGICHTDLIVRDGWFPTPMPAVLGHEGAGIVERVGPGVATLTPGDPVVMSYNSCGKCDHCVTAQPAYCRDFWLYNFSGTTADGSMPIHRDGIPVASNFFGQSSFADFALAHERNVVKVAPGVSLELVGPLGCGVQTGAGAILNTLRPPAGTSIVIFGAGAVGLSALMAAKLSGCTTIIIVDRVASRLELAIELGATAAFDQADRQSAREIRKLTGGGVDYAIEATGVPAVLRVAMDCLAQGGTCGLVGAARAKAEATIDISTLLFGRKLVGIIEGESIPQIFIPRLLDLHAQGRFPFDRFVTQHPFTDLNVAVAGAESGQLIKPVVVM